MMVSLGAACFSLAALGLAHAADDGSGIDVDVQVDPMRIAEGVIGGIGFLGAGAILRNRETVEGLTTAGSIWLVGAVGLAAGSGHYVLASIAVGIAVAILMGVGWLESRWLQRADDCGPE
jgi:putative Mg2+ transporter-C (MgtC) family protein